MGLDTTPHANVALLKKQSAVDFEMCSFKVLLI